MPPAGREETSLRQQFCRGVGASFQLSQAGLRLGQKLDPNPVRGDEILQRRGAVGELRDRLLEVGDQLVQSALAQVAVAATRPRMPLTKRPASSPEKVFASSIDSLIAALVGTRRSIAIS